MSLPLSPLPPPPGFFLVSTPKAASYYTRDEFLELEPVVVTSLNELLRTYLKVSITVYIWPIQPSYTKSWRSRRSRRLRYIRENFEVIVMTIRVS